jgi:hypothetical protein
LKKDIKAALRRKFVISLVRPKIVISKATKVNFRATSSFQSCSCSEAATKKLEYKKLKKNGHNFEKLNS